MIKRHAFVVALGQHEDVVAMDMRRVGGETGVQAAQQQRFPPYSREAEEALRQANGTTPDDAAAEQPGDADLFEEDNE